MLRRSPSIILLSDVDIAEIKEVTERRIVETRKNPDESQKAAFMEKMTNDVQTMVAEAERQRAAAIATAPNTEEN